MEAACDTGGPDHFHQFCIITDIISAESLTDIGI
jgi:hypothetical protein